jgi:ribosomal protein S18 acetylase RimI-like enzyme
VKYAGPGSNSDKIGVNLQIAQITDKGRIQKFLLQDPYLHQYEMGDLQEQLFKHIKWNAAVDGSDIKALSMLYESKDPIFFLLEDGNIEASKQLITELASKLPEKVYCHLTKGLGSIMEGRYTFKTRDDFIKMKLTGDIFVDRGIKYPEYTYRVNRNDFEAINAFLKSINPDAFFHPAMLDTGKYFCIRKNNEILSMAGVHLYTKEFGVAVIGNVATAVTHRGKGYAGSVTASLCRDLWVEVRYVGLNVRANNTPAIKAYEKIGFQKHSEHEEVRAELKKT